MVHKHRGPEETVKKAAVWKLIPLACVVLLVFCGEAEAGRDWALSLYWAQLTHGTLEETVTFQTGLTDSELVCGALSRRIGSFKEYMDFELEGQVAKHFRDQDHWEFNGLAVVRWLPFPWDQVINTSVAVGEGLSYATETPEAEAKRYDKTSKLLDYLMFEVAFSLPSLPEWSLITRIHHRSGAYGLFNGVHGASNAWGVGLRYTF
jgi:hypothetical protein